MKVWLDDIRPAPDSSWRLVVDGGGFKTVLIFNDVFITEISMDHDLGEDSLSGYQLLNWLEEKIHTGILRFPVLEKISVHSQNPVGVQNMNRAIQSIMQNRS